jgi:hypothetical protein
MCLLPHIGSNRVTAPIDTPHALPLGDVAGWGQFFLNGRTAIACSVHRQHLALTLIKGVQFSGDC